MQDSEFEIEMSMPQFKSQISNVDQRDEMRRVHPAIMAMLVCIFGNEIYAQRTTPVIRQVDHILIESGDPKALFSFFADTLQLPIAWPISENQGYTTGGVGAGNVNLELFRYARIRKGLP
jgi:hypothetical protein